MSLLSGNQPPVSSNSVENQIPKEAENKINNSVPIPNLVKGSFGRVQDEGTL